MTTHKLKTYPAPFRATRAGDRPFEIRRGRFEQGDILILQEFIPCEPCKGRGEDHIGDTCCPACLGSKGRYTGNELKVEVTYVSNFRQPFNQFVLGLDLLDPAHRDSTQEELPL
jgi:hypothetical protein